MRRSARFLGDHVAINFLDGLSRSHYSCSIVFLGGWSVNDSAFPCLQILYAN